MKNIIILSVILLCAIIQVTFIEPFRIFGVKPDLLLICVCITGLMCEWRLALFFGFYAGALKDLLGTDPFGFNILLYVCWSYFIAKVARKISLEDTYALMAVSCVVFFIDGIAKRIILSSYGKYVSFGISFRIIVLSCLYSTLLIPLVLKLFTYCKCLPASKEKSYEI